MTENKPIIINGYNLEYIKELLYNSQRSAITTNIFEAIIDELELKTQECEALKVEEQYLKQCCIKAGKELAKNSFAWDGKEKNLVVQAMELNEKYNQAEQKLEKIKDKCNETLELMDKDSGTNAYAGGRCTEAGQILHIIDEVE